MRQWLKEWCPAIAGLSVIVAAMAWVIFGFGWIFMPSAFYEANSIDSVRAMAGFRQSMWEMVGPYLIGLSVLPLLTLICEFIVRQNDRIVEEIRFAISCWRGFAFATAVIGSVALLCYASQFTRA